MMTATEPTLQQIFDKVNELHKVTLIGVKNDLQIDEAAYTGLSQTHLYRLAYARKIPHYRQSRKLYFNKADLDRFLESNRVMTDTEINNKATTYVSINK